MTRRAASVQRGSPQLGLTPGTWTNQSVTVDLACTDALSGVASLTPDPVTFSGSGQIRSEHDLHR